LKVMVAQIADDPELKKRFEREAKAVARMTHPNVVMVFDLGYHEDGSPFIAMELLRGEDLHKAMRRPITLDRKLAIIIQVLAGLSHAHKAGIIHRDIKPANIFLNEDGTTKIMDFGVARLQSASMTGTGHVVGTADYMSPEQVKGAHVDGRSDIFSVGCVLYELLAGARPFHSDNLMTIFYKITHEEPDYSKIPKESQEVLPLIQKALVKDLDGRYQTAYAFAVDLREYLSRHTSSTAGRHALESVGEIEAPSGSHPPGPITDSPGATVVTETVDDDMGAGATAVIEERTTLKGGSGRGTSTVVEREARTLREGAARRPAARAPVEGTRAPRPTVLMPPPRAESRVGLYASLGVVVLAALGGVGYFLFRPSPPAQVLAPTPAPPTTLVAQATVPPPTLAATPPPTMAPQVTTPPRAREGNALARAEGFLGAGDYDDAVTEARRALQDAPASERARKLLRDALNGQNAARDLQAAEASLGRGDLARARQETEAARAVYPADPRIADLLERIGRAQPQPQPPKAEPGPSAAQRVATLLNQADSALTSANYDLAISLYDDVLKLDPSNPRAGQGKTGAAVARAQSLAYHAPAAAHSFVPAKTQASAADTRAEAGIPGFEQTAGVTAKQATQAAQLPGQIVFDVQPPSVKPGETYKVRVFLQNEGNAPIQIQSLMVTTSINGKRSSNPVPPLTKTAAPQQKAPLLEIGDLWKEDTTSWSLEVKLTTTRDETYKSQLTWK
ncbi:MAG TPA: protein kinase, partial [Vicinamibacteria bacterium]|nr:protein kinase [Vicinamibacteria bacterium]